MYENRYYYKQNTYTSNSSDDSSCSFSLPWRTGSQRRGSRLGKHGRNVRVLQDINNQNIELLDENNESSNKPSDKASVSLVVTKPTDTDTNSHDVGFMKSNDAINTSFMQLKKDGVDISFSNFDMGDMMDISISKADTNHYIELIDAGQFSLPDETRFNNEHRTAYSPESILKTSNHSSFENDVLNLHRSSYSNEFILNGNLQPSTKSNDIFNPLRTALAIDMVLRKSDYSSMLDEGSVEHNQSPSRAVDLVMKNDNNVSPKDVKSFVNRRTPLPPDLVLKTNDYYFHKENIPPTMMDEVDSNMNNNYLPLSDDSSCSFSLPWVTDTRRRKSRLGKHGQNLRVLQDINKQNIKLLNENDESSNKPLDKASVLLDCTKPIDTHTDSHDVGFMKSNNALNTSFMQLKKDGIDISFSNIDMGDMMDISISKADTNHYIELTDAGQFNNQHRTAYSPESILKTSNHSSFENDVLNLHRNSYSNEFILNGNLQPLTKSNDVFNPLRTALPIDMVLRKSDYSSMLDEGSVEHNQSPSRAVDLVMKNDNYVSPKDVKSVVNRRTPLPPDLVLKTNDYHFPKENIPPTMMDEVDSNMNNNYCPTPEVFPKSGQLAVAKPSENYDAEFKQPEAVRPAKIDDFQFEAPLPPPIFKVSEKLPSSITVKGKPYSVTRELGRGGSSKVYEVSHPVHGNRLAIKQVKLFEVDESIAEGYIQEVKLLKKLQTCESIVRMYDHEIIYENDEKVLNIVMEKGDTDLAELLKNVNKNKDKKPSIDMILSYWTKMLSAVFEIHNEGIVHSDLKPANFLIVKGKLKLIDFGIASSMQSDMTSVYKDVFTGTLNYMSPEAVRIQNSASGSIGYRINFKTDVWSLGCILYHLIYGKLPFQHLKKRWDKIQAIIDPKIEIEFSDAKGVPEVLMSALKSCLNKDPNKRMTVGQLLQLPYYGSSPMT